ncbi:hypothetical protein U8330_18055 [Rhizobium sp. CC-YZS058]|nr:hypothetical protein [Rhizobium sp. CC-YZS058]
MIATLLSPAAAASAYIARKSTSQLFVVAGQKLGVKEVDDGI